MFTRSKNTIGLGRLLSITFLALFIPILSHAQGVISGKVGNPGISNAMVFVCSAASGLPLDAQNNREWSQTNLNGLLCITTAPSGTFIFSNIPSGTYRLIAQSSSKATNSTRPNPFLGLWPAEHVILHGVAENIVVPSAKARNIMIVPLGKGEVTYDQRFPNNEGVIFFSTKPILGDPVLGFLGWTPDFITHIIGVGRMAIATPLTVSGLPESNVQAAIFMNDNSPGFGATYYWRLPNETQRIPIVASWSDGEHVPPPRIQHVMNAFETSQTNAAAFLNLKKPTNTSLVDLMIEFKQMLGPLDREVVLPNEEKATVADIYAGICYSNILRYFPRSNPNR